MLSILKITTGIQVKIKSDKTIYFCCETKMNFIQHILLQTKYNYSALKTLVPFLKNEGLMSGFPFTPVSINENSIPPLLFV